MKYLSALKKEEEETWRDYCLRLRYSVLRRIHPKYREQYRLEKLVGPSNSWQELLQYQFNLLTGVGIKPEHSLLDIGCGALTTGLRLIPYLNPGCYVGVDLRPQPLIEAYRLIAKHSLVDKNPALIKSANFGQEEIGPRQFDFIWMSQLSYHLDDGLMSKLFGEAQARLYPHGRLLFDIMDPERNLPAGIKWSGFKFHIRPLDYYADLGRCFGFTMRTHGQIVTFGYPKRIDLHTNLLLDFRKESAAHGTAR
jgi:SAM-dependent methyltransferase